MLIPSWKMNLWRSLAAFGMFILLATFPSGSMAQSESLTYTGSTTSYDSLYQQTIGWDFTTYSIIHVNSLDWYDPLGQNDIDHAVDLWTSTGSLVGTACVGEGCKGSSYSASTDYWLTPVNLALGPGTYVIGGWVDKGEPFVYGAGVTSITTTPDITFDAGLYKWGSGIEFPTNVVWPSGPIVGPNFGQGSPLPEPSSAVLVSIALLAVFMARKRIAQGLSR